MIAMFASVNGTSRFNQDISSWDVSSVTNMSDMFVFVNGDISLSDANKCAIHNSFSSNGNWSYDWSELCASVVFQPQSKTELQTAVDLWVSDKTTALATYGEINTWDVSLITNMDVLFHNKAHFNDDISAWNVSNVTNMYAMFKDAESFNQDISAWDVSNLIHMEKMFWGAASFNQDIGDWDVSSVTMRNSHLLLPQVLIRI